MFFFFSSRRRHTRSLRDWSSDVCSSDLPHVKSGKLRAIAMASTSRSTVVPDVPAMAESVLPGFNVSPWFGLFYPSGTPAAIVDQLYADVTHKVLSAPDVRQRIVEQGAEVAPSASKKEFAAFVARENLLWGKVVREVMSGPAAAGG